jgi:hypothetical protein
MKLTKSQLNEIIREELSKFNGISSIFENWILNEDGETVTNPKTGRTIKVSTALSYPKSHPAYSAAIKYQDGKEFEKARTEKSARSQEKGKQVSKDFNKTSKTGSFSSETKSDNILSKLSDNGRVDWDAFDRLPKKTQEKISALAKTRVELYDKLEDKRYDYAVSVAKSAGSAGKSPWRDRGDDSLNFDDTGVKLTGKQAQKYESELEKFKSEYGDGDDTMVQFNAKWTEENPKLPTISKKALSGVAPKLKVLKDITKKQDEMWPTMKTARELSDI